MKQSIMMKRARTRQPSALRSKQTNTPKTNSHEHSQADNLKGNIRNNIQNSVEKFTALARDAMTAGDRVLAESYYQQAEHYLRLSSEYKENIVVLPRVEETAPAPELISMVNDFEVSIEQELTAHAGL